MNEQNTQGWTPFKQIPEWSDTETFQITGAQLKSIQKLFEAYTPLVKSVEPIFIQGLEDGKITIRYEDLNGNPLMKEDIDAMLQRYAEEMAKAVQGKVTMSPEEDIEPNIGQ